MSVRRVGGLALFSLLLSLCVLFPAATADAASALSFERIGGEDRYETSALVADDYGPSDSVILANGEPGSFADALSANYIAGRMDAPILLTREDHTPKAVLDRLEDSGAKDVVIVGGAGVVSNDQATRLREAGYAISRISGADRFATNAEVIATGSTIGSDDSGAGNDNQTAEGLGIIATGADFPDALAAGPLSYHGHPLGLAGSRDIDDDVVKALKDAGVERVLVIGGTSAVDNSVVSELENKGISVAQRFAGSNRSETAALAASYAVANLGFGDTAVNVASGYPQGYGADALAGGPLAGKQDRALLVTRSVKVPGQAVCAWLNGRSDLARGTLFGGTSAVSARAQQLMEHSQRCDDGPPPGWERARTLDTGVSHFDVGANAAGDAAAVWYRDDNGAGATHRLSRQKWEKPSKVGSTGDGIYGPHVAVHGNGSAAVMATTRDMITLRFHPRNGGWQDARHYEYGGTDDGGFTDTDLVAASDLDTIASWVDDPFAGPTFLEAVRQKGGSWGKANVASAPPGTPTVAGPAGTLIAAGEYRGYYQNEEGEFTNYAHTWVRADDGGWSQASRLGTGEMTGPVALTAAPDGTAYAVVTTRDSGADDDSRYRVQLFVKPPGEAWGSAETVASGEQIIRDPAVTLADSGSISVAWDTGARTEDGQVFSSTRSRAGDWTPPRAVSPVTPQLTRPDLASDPDGNVVAVWSSTAPGAQPRAAYRPHGESWYEPVTLAAPATTKSEAPRPRIVADSSGRFTALFVHDGELRTMNRVG